MNFDTCRRLILRDLQGMRDQIGAYPDEELLWTRPPGVANPAGNLALHVEGNLRHFVGHVLGGLDYHRDRDAEFSTARVARSRLDSGLARAASDVDQSLGGRDDRQLGEPFPIEVAGEQLRTGVFLTHLCGHLAYHLGQVDVHRRITTGQGALPGIQGFGGLLD